jgi:hypothetical protein
VPRAATPSIGFPARWGSEALRRPPDADRGGPAEGSDWFFKSHRTPSSRDCDPEARLTEEEAHLIGISRDFYDRDGGQMYIRAAANRGPQLRRRGATEACIVCGIPALPGTTAFAHIHWRDVHLSPRSDPTRVFCLCWHHHHGCYDQGYIITIGLLRAEEVWVENKRRPKPHRRDIAMMKRVSNGDVTRQCAWTEKRLERRPIFYPSYPPPPFVRAKR